MMYRALLALSLLLAACDLSGFAPKPVEPSLMLAPNPLYLAPGSTSYLSLSIPKETGLSGEVSLSLEGAPLGVALSPQTVFVGEEGGYFPLTLLVGTDVSPGDYSLTFVAASQTARKAAPLDLVVLRVEEAAFQVDTTEDTHDADPDDGSCKDSSNRCSLRAALEQAGALPLKEDALLRVRIILPDGVYPLSEGLELEFAERVEVSLEGAGQDRTVLDGGDRVRLLQISRGTKALIKGMTLRRGLAQADAGIPPSDLPFAGGAIHNAGNLTLEDTRIEGSRAAYGGAIYNTGFLALKASLIRANAATLKDQEGGVCQRGCGGGIYNDGHGTAILAKTTLEENEAGRGGGLYTTGLLTLKGSTLRGNRAEDGAGAYVGAYLLEGAQKGILAAEDSTFEGNRAQGKGGGIYSEGTVSLETTTLSANEAVKGGGIYSTGDLELHRSNLLSNTAQEGAGVYSDGKLTLKASSVVNNTGSGIYSTGELALANATTSGNTAGIRSAGPLLALSFSTIADGLEVLSGKATLKGVALAGACQGALTSAGWNLLRTPDRCQVALQGTDRTGDPLLLPLTKDGGVWVHPPAADSSLIDRVPPTDCTDLSGTPLDKDARGVARPRGPACDTGAVEY